ncbi:MAG: acetylornithine/succinyldiaminopimelate transaminase [Acidimicrobiales bacterium]
MADLGRSDYDRLMMPNYNPADFVPARGVGSRVQDTDGVDYVDLAGGIATTALGHAHPELVAVLVEQANALWHMSNAFATEPYLRLAESLIRRTFDSRVFFSNSGGEANEAAFKLARRYAYDHHGEQKREIISFSGSFHGRTLFTVSVGGKALYTEGFGPLPGGITHLEFNDVGALEAAVGPQTCAVVLEPVQGEGGVIPATAEFVEAARRLCDKHGAVLVFDEVQSGVGRTGTLYAYEQFGVQPDILTTAKALGNGIPIAATLAIPAVAASLVVGTHGSTFGGNPMACAVGAKVLELVDTPEVLDGVAKRHDRLVSRLSDIDTQGVFSQIRGMGLLVGAELKPDFAGRAKALQVAAMKAGVLCLIAGPNVMRFAPSLIIDMDDLDLGLDRFEKAFADETSTWDA